MKGIRSVNMTKILGELNELKECAKRINEPDFIQATLLEDGSWNIKANFTKSKKYKSEVFNVDNIHKAFAKYKEYPKLPVILDDMLMNNEIYLPTMWIYEQGREKVKRFIEIIASGDEIEFMNVYIELFDECFGRPEPDYINKYPGSVRTCVNGEWITEDDEAYKAKKKRYYEQSVEITRDVLSKEPVLLDFFDHYKKLTVDELIERYTDQRFFDSRRNERN
jgi:hypothetical protein